MGRGLAGASLALVALLVLPACGGSKHREAPTLALIAHRFSGLGYRVTRLPHRSKQPYEGGIVIHNIDSDTQQSFHVAVYRFGSEEQAKAHQRALVASFGRFPQSNQWQLDATDLFVGTTASTELKCRFSRTGRPSCTTFTFPHSRFAGVVAVAESA